MEGKVAIAPNFSEASIPLAPWPASHTQHRPDDDRPVQQRGFQGHHSGDQGPQVPLELRGSPGMPPAALGTRGAPARPHR